MSLIPNPGRKAWLRYALIYLVWLVWLGLTTSGNSSSLTEWIDQWARWDAEWYSRIFRDGYGADPRSLVFMPGFSFLTAAVGSVLGLSFEAAAFVLNTVCYFFTSVIICEFLSKRFQVPWWTLLIVQLANPVAFYAVVPYSDALFALLFWCALCFAIREPETLSKKETYAFGALLFFAPWVRITGFTLAVWLVFRRWLAFLVFIPLVCYLYINYARTGDAFYFLRAQKAFLMPAGWLLDGIRYTWWEFKRPPRFSAGWQMTLFWVQTAVFPVFSSVLILVSAAWLAKRREIFLFVTLVAVAFYSRNQAYWRSVLRYDWPLMALVVLPWINWSMFRVAERKPAVRIQVYLARVILVGLLLIGLVFQTGIARLLHVGIWAY